MLKIKMLKDRNNRQGVINFIIILKELHSNIPNDTKNFEPKEFYNYCTNDLFNWINSDAGKNTIWHVLGQFIVKDKSVLNQYMDEIVS